jgi:hypothetical protein
MSKAVDAAASPRHQAWGVMGIGVLLILVVQFSNPLGDSPDSGLVDLGPTGTKRLLEGFGLCFVLAGLWLLLRKRGGGAG